MSFFMNLFIVVISILIAGLWVAMAFGGRNTNYARPIRKIDEPTEDKTGRR